MTAQFKLPPQTSKSKLISGLREYYKGAWKPLTQKNCNTIDFISLGRNLCAQLDKIEITLSHAIIENQITSRMTTLQGMLALYFITKKVPLVEFISPVHKLKGFATPDDRQNMTPHKRNKRDGIDCCDTLLREKFPAWVGYWETSNKKDDLADSFLQGVWYSNTYLRTI